MAAASVALAILAALPSPSARAAEPVRDSAMAVSVVRAVKRCFTDRLAASGTFVARRPVAVRPERDGLVVSDVLVEPGDAIAKDQVLAHLIAPDAPMQEIDVKSPAAGVLLAAGAVVGAYTSVASGDPLFTIAADADLELQAQIPATGLSRARTGMKATVHVVGLGEIEGRIASIDDGLDPQSQLGTLRLSVKPDPRLLVGSFARAEIEVGQDCGLAVPLSALLFGQESAVVATVESDRVVMRAVTTGLLDGGTIEIRDGLTQDDRVIARAGPFLREGDHVRPVPDAP